MKGEAHLFDSKLPSQTAPWATLAFKVNFDAAWSGSAFGFLVRDHLGFPIMAGAKFSLVSSPQLAKQLAASWAKLCYPK